MPDLKSCICKSCPSWADCGGQDGFCFKSKSKCIGKEKGCICGGCPVFGAEGLAHYYYCTRGTEKQQGK